MKPALIISALSAAAAMMGGSQHAAHQFTLRPPEDPLSTRTSRRKDRVAQNQRQRRLDRRRAHAAGQRNAFS